MEKAAFQFLSDLLATPSVSGFEQRAAGVVRKWLSPHVDDTRTDVHGNTFFVLNPKGSPRVMLAGHIDQIGFLVNHITDQGYLYVVPVRRRARESSDRAQNLPAVAKRSNADLFQVVIGQLRQDREIDIILGKALRVLRHTELFEPVRNPLHRRPMPIYHQPAEPRAYQF